MGEARALQVRDVDFKRGMLHVRHALSADEVMPPKSGHERPVPLAPELLAVLEGAVRLKLPTRSHRGERARGHPHAAARPQRVRVTRGKRLPPRLSK
jgi:integrase